tara:strand:+ start:214 stop:885 length:672 start_codon:yes stop_codon:yes gene_type:complete
MALSFGENLGVLGNIKLTDVKLVAGAFRTIASGSDTGSITVQRVEDGQIVYIQSEDRLIKASKSGASVNWSSFFFPSASAGAETAGIFVATGSSFNTTNDLQITGSLTISSSVVDMTGTTAISGSTFSGSFVGDGSGLSGVTSPITIKDEGSNLTTAVSSINFVGSGVTATTSGDDVTATIAGADLVNVFESDGNGDLQPADSDAGISVFYELDGNGDITTRT